jgi:hypothetical protein
MNPTKFCCRKEIKTKQGYDKKKTPKTNFEQIKGSGEFYLYLYLLGT